MVERRLTPVALRRAFVSDEHRRQVGGWAGVVAAALMVFFALDGRWLFTALFGAAAVVLLWLSGVWVRPRSADAYERRVAYACEAWATAAQRAYDEFTYRSRRLRSAIERLPPPLAFEREHAHLLALLTDIERARVDRSVPFPDRVRRSVAAGRAVDELAERLRAAAGTAEEDRYCEKLLAARHRNRAEHATAAGKAEEATARLLARLSRMQVPPAAGDDHAALVRGFEAYLAAVRRFHAAGRDQLADAAADAAAEVDAAIAVLRASSRAIRASLEYDERWPQSDAAAAEP